MHLEKLSAAQLTFFGSLAALLFGFVATFVMVFGGMRTVEAIGMNEVEPNNTIATAQNIDNQFSLNFDANIGDTTSNTSTTIPYVMVNGVGDESLDYYSFTVKNAGEKAIFDIDFASNSLDSFLRLFDSSGTLLAASDDSPVTLGQGGSVSGLDSYIEYTLGAPGTYVIEVGAFIEGPVPTVVPAGIATGERYQLQVSIENSATPFDRFTIDKAEIRFADDPSEQKIRFEGKFTLDPRSNSADALREKINILVGTSLLSIPAGSFVADASVFEFDGAVGGVDVNMKLEEFGIYAFKFVVTAAGIELTNIANPLEIRLMIGDDAGTASIMLEGELQFELADSDR